LLSYRHSFHAGNFADVIKHIVVIEILEHLIKKERPFDYIDTHAGVGLYNLNTKISTKLEEFTNGIGKLEPKAWPELARYFSILKQYDPSAALNYYPGSPLIAMSFLRAKDRAWLFEMHPADFKLLAKNIAGDDRVKAMRDDGYKGLLPLLPPVSRRGLILIDPSYELKTDYDQVVEVVLKAYKKFSTGTYAIWYPVVDRKRIVKLESKFINSGIKNIQRFELGITADSRATGMSAAGMIVINPPWKLMEKISAVLPKLVDVLGEDGGAFFKCDVLVAE